jgi:NTP pyrophosphatase (non-canonical NTP hydrolase)
MLGGNEKMGMTFVEYQNLAARTANKHENEMINYAMGVAGESGELVDLVKKCIFHGHDIDKAKIKKEAGDVYWYTSQLIRLFGFDTEGFKYDFRDHPKELPSLMEDSLMLSSLAGDISYEVLLKNMGGLDLKSLISTFLMVLHHIINFAGITPEEVFEANIEKLKKRYPNGFSTEDSIKRVDTKEL